MFHDSDLRVRLVASGALVAAAVAAGGAVFGLSGCQRERPWASEESPPMALAPGEARQASRLGPAEEQAIRQAALRIAGGEAAWDGTRRLTAAGPRWADVPDALAAACARPDIQCVIREVVADGRGDVWAFDLITAEREPGRFRLERFEVIDGGDGRDGGEDRAADDAASDAVRDGAGGPVLGTGGESAVEDGPLWRVTEVALGRRPDAAAMRLRAGRLVDAFKEELARIGDRPRFGEPAGS